MHTLKLRPAILPDDMRLLGLVLFVEIGLGLIGVWYFEHWLIMLVSLVCIFLFPGLPLLVHFLYHFSVSIHCDSVGVTVVDWVSSPFVKTRGRQTIKWQDVKYVYPLGYEIDFLEKQESASIHGDNDEAMVNVFKRSLFNLEKWHRLHGRSKYLAGSRARRGLVLSDDEGYKKIYCMHFADLAREDQKQFTNQIKLQQQDVRFVE